MSSTGREVILSRIRDERKKILDYAILIEQATVSTVPSNQNAILDIIEEYRFKIQEAKDAIAYLDLELACV